jgi:Xaa-Pro aminopeptidase
MVLTVEPGIYLPPGLAAVPKAWRGIGVRIEDDVAVTDGEPEVLTASLPADPDAIERLVQDG